jgi:hypothetical protein
MPSAPDYDAGDLVVCVNDDPLPGRSTKPKGITLGHKYIVERVFVFGEGCVEAVQGHYGVKIVGVPNRNDLSGFVPFRFRRIDGAPDIFACMLTEKVLGELEPVD